ncbi:MAG: sarcosine oxidase subunit gamma family protein [Pseudomonadota bacterium]
MAEDAVLSETEGLTVRREDAVGMVTLKADLSVAPVAAAIEAATGAPIPARLRASVGEGDAGPATVVWMAPDEVLIVSAPEAAGGVVEMLETRLAGNHVLALDMSSARAVFWLEGPRWREVIAKGAPVDLRPAAFGAGTARRTHLGQVAVGFWADPADANRVTLVCFRSVADYVAAWLIEAARPEGAVGLFAEA